MLRQKNILVIKIPLFIIFLACFEKYLDKLRLYMYFNLNLIYKCYVRFLVHLGINKKFALNINISLVNLKLSLLLDYINR